MSWSYRKRIKVSQNTHQNVSNSGLSANLGKKGANFTLGSSGAHLNLGIPGTGLHSRINLFNPSNSETSSKNSSYRFHRRGPSVLVSILLFVF